jgi:hypothetical protein
MMLDFEQIVSEINIPEVQNTKHINIKQLLWFLFQAKNVRSEVGISERKEYKT